MDVKFMEGYEICEQNNDGTTKIWDIRDRSNHLYAFKNQIYPGMIKYSKSRKLLFVSNTFGYLNIYDFKDKK